MTEVWRGPCAVQGSGWVSAGLEDILQQERDGFRIYVKFKENCSGWQMKRNTFVLRRKERALPALPWHVPAKRAAVLLSSWCHVNYASPCEPSFSDAQLLGGRRLSLGEAWKSSHPKLSQVLLSNIDIVIAVF